VEKHGRAELAVDDNMERWITKATNTHSEYVIFIAFQRQPAPNVTFSMTTDLYSVSDRLIYS
jgi:hypothetical protein